MSVILNIVSVEIASASIILLIEADYKISQAEYIIKNLSRLELIRALAYKDKFSKEELDMKIKFKKPRVSNVSNTALALTAIGIASLGAGIVKSQVWDKSNAPQIEEGAEQPFAPSGLIDRIKGTDKVTLGLEGAGVALIIAGTTKAIIDVRHANAVLAADDDLPPVVDPTAGAEED